MLEYLRSHTVEQTADQFKISSTTVRRRARRAGISNIEEYQIREDKINLDELKSYFIDHTLEDCEKKFKLGARYLSLRLREAGVDTTVHSLMSGIDIDTEKLKEFFKTHTMEECSKEFNCSYITIKRRLQENSIDTSSHNHSEIAYQKFMETRKDISFLTKEFLYKEYIVENKDANLIAEENKVHFNTVLMKLREYNLNVKSRERVAESLMIKHFKKTGYWWPGQMPEVLEKIFRGKPRYKYSPIKNKVESVIFKSQHELGLAMQLDLDDDIIEWTYEKVQIPYVDGDDGRNRLYYIDFDVTYRDGHREWIEVKPRDGMIPQDKMLYAANEAKKQNIKYREMTDQERIYYFELFFAGHATDRIEFLNVKEFKSHRGYTLWFKNIEDALNVEHNNHYAAYKEMGKYVRCRLTPKHKKAKDPVSSIQKH